ncbi:MAG: glycine cleavage system aminomethyltransferase GcvT [Aquificaceae bacterium]|jgi:aminomethyltransferase|uniref:glycine cleavage system aminomethyltransferase GcvT n=1 Tax=Hydrogenobacter sp. Uz 6-8 TaxID=3384828 RepID=UPI003096D0AD
MRTPLYSQHRALGARFFQFAGWEMPLEYTSIAEEARAVRNSCGLFDISHMGRLLIFDGFDKLQYLTSRNIEGLKVGKVHYNLFLNPEGGIKEDITFYRLSEEEFFMCVNAGNREKVVAWLKENGLSVKDMSKEWVQFALQGPEAVSLLDRYFPVKDMKYYSFQLFGNTLVSRTGYTGEDGFEVYAPLKEGVELFMEISMECMPCGLGARDVLRIEAGMPLYGHEISEDISPFEANLDRYVSLNKDFIGKEALLGRRVERRLFGLEILQRGVPREGYKIFYQDREIGYVSSGTFSPNLQKGIALCFVSVDFRIEGLEVHVQVRNRRLPARLRSYPFLKKA